MRNDCFDSAWVCTFDPEGMKSRSKESTHVSIIFCTIDSYKQEGAPDKTHDLPSPTQMIPNPPSRRSDSLTWFSRGISRSSGIHF